MPIDRTANTVGSLFGVVRANKVQPVVVESLSYRLARWSFALIWNDIHHSDFLPDGRRRLLFATKVDPLQLVDFLPTEVVAASLLKRQVRFLSGLAFQVFPHLLLITLLQIFYHIPFCMPFRILLWLETL